MPKRHKDAPPEEELYAPIEWRADGDYDDIVYERGDSVAKITINRPEVRNAFRPPTLAELRDAFTRARDDMRDRVPAGYGPPAGVGLHHW